MMRQAQWKYGVIALLCGLALAACQDRSNKDSVTFETKGGDPIYGYGDNDPNLDKNTEIETTGGQASALVWVVETQTEKTTMDGAADRIKTTTYHYDELGRHKEQINASNQNPPQAAVLGANRNLVQAIWDDFSKKYKIEYDPSGSSATLHTYDKDDNELSLASISFNDTDLTESINPQNCNDRCTKNRYEFDDLKRIRLFKKLLNDNTVLEKAIRYEGDQVKSITITRQMADNKKVESVRNFEYGPDNCVAQTTDIEKLITVQNNVPQERVLGNQITDFDCESDPQGRLKRQLLRPNNALTHALHYTYNDNGLIEKIATDLKNDQKIDAEITYTYKQVPKPPVEYFPWRLKDPNYLMTYPLGETHERVIDAAADEMIQALPRQN